MHMIVAKRAYSTSFVNMVKNKDLGSAGMQALFSLLYLIVTTYVIYSVALLNPWKALF